MPERSNVARRYRGAMRSVVVLRLAVPSVWFGLVLGLSFIETPLKFQAPGITLPLGLGIGRLVFTALAIAGWVLLVTITALAVPRPRVDRAAWAMIGAMWVVLAVQTLVIRPLLSARSDIIIAGGDPGPSILHYAYVAVDVILLALLVLWVVREAKRLPLALADSGGPTA